MRKNGFTLIELLAVIVILAIIALIATPIILGIINDARDKANERSVELYASAIRNSLAAHQLTGTKAPESFEDLDIQYEGNVKCSVQKLYEDGSFYLDGCKVNNGTKEYSYGTKIEEVVKLSDICTPVTTSTTGNVPTGDYNIGDEYVCEVKDGVNYTFFVLSKEGNKINLIMDSNIREDGIPAKDSNYVVEHEVAWLSAGDYELVGGKVTDEMLNDGDACQHGGYCVLNNFGPITAMKYLATATSTWETGKIDVKIFNDKEGNVYEMKEVITSSARLPYLNEVEETGCSLTYNATGTCPLWMVNYLRILSSTYPDGESGSPSAYWTLTVDNYGSSYAWTVDSRGFAYNGAVGYDYDYGVRPVITLSI